MSGPMGEHPYHPQAPDPQAPYPQQPYHQRPTYLPPAPAPGPRQPAPPAGHSPGRSVLSGRSRRFWYAVALVVLLPAWLGFSVWRAADQSYGTDTYGTDTTVDRGSAAEVAGATWRLGSIAPAPPPHGSLTTAPPRGSTLIRAYIDVTPHTAAAAKNIVGCSFAAQDDQGRVWEKADAHYVEPDLTVPDSCVPPGFGAHYIPAGHTQKVGVTFLVPTDAARSLRPMVRPSYRTHYVLFQ